MGGAKHPPISDLVPHSGRMCLLEEVLEHSAERTRCRVDPGASALLADPDGAVPIWVGLEYMAQCVAVHGGLASRARGEAPRPGLFLGSRRVRFGAQQLPTGTLEVESRHHAGERGLVAFDCSVREAPSGDVLLEGRVNVYVVDGWHDLMEESADGD